MNITLKIEKHPTWEPLAVVRLYHRNMVGLMPAWDYLLKSKIADRYDAWFEIFVGQQKIIVISECFPGVLVSWCGEVWIDLSNKHQSRSGEKGVCFFSSLKYAQIPSG